MLGYLPQDLIGQMCYEYFHPDDIRKMVELFHEGELGIMTIIINVIEYDYWFQFVYDL